MYVQQINMVFIAFAAFPWCFRIDQCRYFITNFHNKTEMHDNRHIVDAVYMHIIK